MNMLGFSQGRLTTLILVRHAEKDKSTTGKDPDLSEEGRRRANRLAEVLAHTEVASVYTTPYQRTRQTVAPLATSKKINLKEYRPGQTGEIDRMITENEGKTVLVCGHSNTIPAIANYLTGTDNYKDFDEHDYGNLMVITFYHPGQSARVTWLNY